MVGNEAWPHDALSTCFYTRFRMKMTGHFDCVSFFIRQVAKDRLSDDDSIGRCTADIGWRRGIVVAGHPDPVMVFGQCLELFTVGTAKAGKAIRVMKAIAKTDDALRRPALQDRSQPFDRRSAVIGGDDRALTGEGRSLFEMEVGNHQQVLIWPDECAGAVRYQALEGRV